MTTALARSRPGSISQTRVPTSNWPSATAMKPCLRNVEDPRRRRHWHQAHASWRRARPAAANAARLLVLVLGNARLDHGEVHLHPRCYSAGTATAGPRSARPSTQRTCAETTSPVRSQGGSIASDPRAQGVSDCGEFTMPPPTKADYRSKRRLKDWFATAGPNESPRMLRRCVWRAILKVVGWTRADVRFEMNGLAMTTGWWKASMLARRRRWSPLRRVRTSLYGAGRAATSSAGAMQPIRAGAGSRPRAAARPNRLHCPRRCGTRLASSGAGGYIQRHRGGRA